jgi:amino acid transporter
VSPACSARRRSWLLKALAVVAALLAYVACALSVLVMRVRDVHTDAPPFRVPGGPLVPALACVVVAVLLARAALREYNAVALALAVAAALYALQRRRAAPVGMGQAGDGRSEL